MGSQAGMAGGEAPGAVGWKVDFGGLQGENGMGPAGFPHYARTKCLMHMIGVGLAKRFDESGDANAPHVAIWHPGERSSCALPQSEGW